MDFYHTLQNILIIIVICLVRIMLVFWSFISFFCIFAIKIIVIGGLCRLSFFVLKGMLALFCLSMCGLGEVSVRVSLWLVIGVIMTCRFSLFLGFSIMIVASHLCSFILFATTETGLPSDITHPEAVSNSPQ